MNKPIPSDAILVICFEDDHCFWADGHTYEQISEWTHRNSINATHVYRYCTWEEWQCYMMRVSMAVRGD